MASGTASASFIPGWGVSLKQRCGSAIAPEGMLRSAQCTCNRVPNSYHMLILTLIEATSLQYKQYKPDPRQVRWMPRASLLMSSPTPLRLAKHLGEAGKPGTGSLG